ncbi:MAG: phosphodiesterase [Simplicispira sp.]|nr:phosphodiesterase [Simplicispira sp.]
MAPHTDLTQRAPVCWRCAPTGTPHRPALALPAPAPALSEIPATSVARLLGEGTLRAHYQPIVRLDNAEVVAHESLIRLPAGHALRNPDELFHAAREQGALVCLEQACLDEGLRTWRSVAGRLLFLNLSAFAVVEMVDRLSAAGVARALEAAGVPPSAVVIEITEHDAAGDISRLVHAATQIRACGVRFALDDFGEGRSSLRLWAELRPDYVKIDKYFVAGIDADPVKLQIVRGLIRFAEISGTHLVAEGIETEAELRVVRDLGIPLGQGYGLGRPQAEPAAQVLPTAQAVIASGVISVLPGLARAGGGDVTLARVTTWVDPQPPAITVNELADVFQAHGALKAIALVDRGQPVGLVNRQTFNDSYSRPFFKELYGRLPAKRFANTNPLVLPKHAGVEAMTEVLISADQRYLSEGFIVTENGQYAGLGSGQQLVRLVTEVRIEAARHANPLTFLPGNIPINEHIQRLLRAGRRFVACYADLNDFKPFNDHYGYWQGDEMIRLAARTLVSHCEPQRDFVGHVGGDDFMVLFQSDDWEQRCRSILDSFNARARGLFDEPARQRGGIDAEDRHGVRRFFPFTTLSLGAIVIRPGQFDKADAVASAAAAAKHKAKMGNRGLVVAPLC